MENKNVTAKEVAKGIWIALIWWPILISLWLTLIGILAAAHPVLGVMGVLGAILHYKQSWIDKN